MASRSGADQRHEHARLVADRKDAQVCFPGGGDHRDDAAGAALSFPRIVAA